VTIPVVLPIPQQSMSWLSQCEGTARDAFRRKWSDMLLSGLLSKGYVRVQSGRVFTTEAGARFRKDHVNARSVQF
jgi:hypothetical protein